MTMDTERDRKALADKHRADPLVTAELHQMCSLGYAEATDEQVIQLGEAIELAGKDRSGGQIIVPLD
jgi:hypothetical protein